MRIKDRPARLLPVTQNHVDPRVTPRAAEKPPVDGLDPSSLKQGSTAPFASAEAKHPQLGSSPQFTVKTWQPVPTPAADAARSAFTSRSDTLTALRRLDEPKAEIGVTIQAEPEAGWYADAAGQRHLVKIGPSHQLQAELFGAALWRLQGLPAPRCAPALLDQTAAVAVEQIPQATDVASSWFSPQQNVDNYRALLEEHPAARAQLLRGFLLDVLNGNLDGAQNVMQSPAGLHFIDFGGVLDSRPRGGVKKPKYFGPALELAPFLDKLGGVIGATHPALSAPRAELRAELEAMLADGLREHLDAALDHALDGMAADTRTARKEALGDLLQARVDSLRSALA